MATLAGPVTNEDLARQATQANVPPPSSQQAQLQNQFGVRIFSDANNPGYVGLYERGGNGQTGGLRQIMGANVDQLKSQGYNVENIANDSDVWRQQGVYNGTSKGNIGADALGGIFSNYQNIYNDQQKAQQAAQAQAPINAAAEAAYKPNTPPTNVPSLAGMSQQQIYNQSAAANPELAKSNPYTPPGTTMSSYRPPEAPQTAVSASSTAIPSWAQNLSAEDLKNPAVLASLQQAGINPASLNQPFVPPNQDHGMERNLKAEQAYVKNWAGKEGRLPTANEINKAVYGTENPSFNTTQGITPPTTPQDPGRAAYDATANAISNGQKTDPYYTGETPFPQPQGVQGIRPPETQVSGGVSPQTAVSGAVPSYSDTAKSALTSADAVSPAEQTAQSQEDALIKQIADLNAAKEAGLVDIHGQPIPMRFITGQSANLEQRANAQNAGTQAQVDTLERQLSRLQADRASKRQAALDVYNIDSKADEQKTSAATAKKEFDEKVREFDATQAANATKVDNSVLETLTKEGYQYVSTPAQRDALVKQGYDLTQYNGKTYAKAPDLTHTTYKGQTTFYDEAGNVVAPGSSSAVRSSSTTVAGSAKPATPNSSKPVNTVKGKTLDQLLVNYPADFKAHVKSVAGTIHGNLTADTIGSMYQEFNDINASNKAEEAFKTDLNKSLGLLATKGKAAWGPAWNAIKDKYPDISNEMLDQLLNKPKYNP